MVRKRESRNKDDKITVVLTLDFDHADEPEEYKLLEPIPDYRDRS